MNDDPRDPQPDPLDVMRQAADQARAEAGEIMPILAAEWRELVEGNVNPYCAAVIIGQRWRVN